MVLFGGHVWFYWGHAWFYLGACMVLLGACMVLFGGHAWFYSGGVHGFIWGACVVYSGGMRGFIQGGMHGFIWGGVRGFIQGACVVLFGGGMHGFFSFFGYNEIRSMSRWYASYWNAFLFQIDLYTRMYSSRDAHHPPQWLSPLGGYLPGGGVSADGNQQVENIRIKNFWQGQGVK